MNEKRVKDLINRFWNGRASEQECVELLEYLEKADGHESVVPNDVTNFDQVFLHPDRKEELLRQIELNLKAKDSSKGRLGGSGWMPRVAVWAASLLVIFVSYELLKKLDFHQNRKVVAAESVSVVVLDTLSNKGSKPQWITLADQTRVLLYPNSELYFDHRFEQRQVELKGKACFKVAHDSNRIFTVTAGEIVTTDIGTEFEVNALDKGQITVHLKEGKIKVGLVPDSHFEMKEQYLAKGDILKLNTASGRLILEKRSGSPQTSFHKKRLVFARTPLKTVFKQMSMQYSCTILFREEDVQNLTFTGNIEPQDSLSDILNIICAINNLSFSKNNAGFLISKP